MKIICTILDIITLLGIITTCELTFNNIKSKIHKYSKINKVLLKSVLIIFGSLMFYDMMEVNNTFKDLLFSLGTSILWTWTSFFHLKINHDTRHTK